jgi:hypothetical protein
MSTMTRAPQFSNGPRPDQVRGTFQVLGNDGTPQTGVVTAWIDEFGEPCEDPDDAVEFVGFIQEGTDAGYWGRFENEPGLWTHHRVH